MRASMAATSNNASGSLVDAAVHDKNLWPAEPQCRSDGSATGRALATAVLAHFDRDDVVGFKIWATRSTVARPVVLQSVELDDERSASVCWKAADVDGLVNTARSWPSV